MNGRVSTGQDVDGMSPFAVRGIAEGFYGTPFTFPERRDMIRFLGRNDFNFYLYAPKNDRQHRMRWWEQYPKSVMRSFGETINVATSVGVDFCYAISFGVPINFTAPEDLRTVEQKFQKFYDLGCRSFAVLWDDLTQDFADEMNRRAFPDMAHAHSDCSNRLYEWTASLAEPCTFYLCPSEYHGSPPFTSYLRHLGEALHPAIRVFYTGPDICSSSIGLEDVVSVAAVLRRKPVIWDNYPVNDLECRSELHLGPLIGRDPRLREESAGFVANVMTQAEASKIPLITIGEYLKDPPRYMPQGAWTHALERVAGRGAQEPVRRLAENSLASCLQSEQAPRLTTLALRARAAQQSRDGSRLAEALDALTSYCDVLDESCYFAKNRMANLRLRRDLLPWIEALEARIWLTRHAVRALVAFQTHQDYEPCVNSTLEILSEIEREPKSIGGTEIIRFGRDIVRRITDAASLPLDNADVNQHLMTRDHGTDRSLADIEHENLSA